MSKLEFGYAAATPTRLPVSARRAVPPLEWNVIAFGLKDIARLTTPPDFMWVNFGKAPELPSAEAVLKHLAVLEATRREPAFFFISGSALSDDAHDTFVERIYATFHDPSNVVVDLVGQPDLSAAVTKFLAQRKARATRPASSIGSATAAVRVPDADLRSERGRLSIRAISRLFGMDVIEIGRIIGRDGKAALSKTPDARSLQEALQPFADIALLRGPGFGDEEFRKWLNAPNEHMGDRAPIAWLREGRVREVAGFVYGILTGQPS